MSLIIAQSAFLCSLFDTVCSASKGPPLAVADAGPVGLAASFAAFASTLGFSSSTAAVRAWASSFLCRGVDAKTRREESRSSSVGDCRERNAGPVLREHETKPGRKSSRLVNMVFVLAGAQRRLWRRSIKTFLEEALIVTEAGMIRTESIGEGRRIATTMVVHEGTSGWWSSQRRCIACARLIAIRSSAGHGRIRFAAEVHQHVHVSSTSQHAPSTTDKSARTLLSFVSLCYDTF